MIQKELDLIRQAESQCRQIRQQADKQAAEIRQTARREAKRVHDAAILAAREKGEALLEKARQQARAHEVHEQEKADRGATEATQKGAAYLDAAVEEILKGVWADGNRTDV